ncbi:MAG: membrane dipeptidase [Coprococcus sp.]
MENLGMIIDVAHLNDAGIRDVLKFTKKPFVASHSNARHLCSHPRNLNDELLKAIGERGGVIGLNLLCIFPARLERWRVGCEQSGGYCGTCKIYP